MKQLPGRSDDTTPKMRWARSYRPPPDPDQTAVDDPKEVRSLRLGAFTHHPSQLDSPTTTNSQHGAINNIVAISHDQTNSEPGRVVGPTTL